MRASSRPRSIQTYRNRILQWLAQDRSATLQREQVEGDLVLLRWVLLAGATLHLLFSAAVERPIHGWIAVIIYTAANGSLVLIRERGPIPLVVSAALQLLDSGILLLYTAGLQGGIARYLPLYTTMLIVAAIRFGRCGIIASGILGLGITVGVMQVVPDAALAPTFAVNTSTILACAALLGYFAYLDHRQQLRYQTREAELQKRISEITVLHEVSSTAHDLRSEDALQNIVEIVTRFMGFQRAALFLADQVGEMIPHRYDSYRHTARRSGLSPLSMEPALFEAVLQRQRPIVIDGSQGSPEMGIAAALQIAVPLHSEVGPIGVLVADSNDRRATSRSDMKMLSSLARSAVVAIENANLHSQVARMANHDGVTELYNHRYFQEHLREMLQVETAHSSVSLLMIEIDKFKGYNDTFGHRQGDMALFSLSRALESSTQSLNGVVARYGGDEFVVILPRITRRDALRVARQIRDQVYNVLTELLARENLPPVMLSIGVATYPDDAQSASDLIEAADQAMYVVKHSGGNRVQSYSESQIYVKGGTN